MDRKGFVIFIIFVCSGSFLSAQGSDTLEINEVVITATQTLRDLKEIPAQIAVISSEEIEEFPLNNVDDILRSTANIYVNRSWGIFSKNSSVTMRGLESSSRTLVLVDGVPKNKISGGSVNWHNINPDNIDRIEIIKGPASALYGNNAMGGVINIISKKPIEKIAGSVKVFYGTYNTFGGSTNISGNAVNHEKGFYWNINGFYRKGDGYIFEAPEFIDATDVKTGLNEFGGSSKIGYQFNKFNTIEIIYDYYNEKRRLGRKVYEDDGSYESYLTNSVKVIYMGKIKKADIKSVIYYTQEDYYAPKESLNDYNEYKLLDSYSDKSDKGLWLSYTNNIFRNNITIGTEVKIGDVIGEEIYRTSSDYINYGSKMNIYGFFIQDEINLLKNKIHLIIGLRNDIVRFYDGFQQIGDPTRVTGFTEGFREDFNTNNWNAVSPKFALQYSINNRSNIYASYSVGFVPPKLKDLSQTGKISKGFRLANPELKPEYLKNYEFGYSYNFEEKLKVNTALYYSIGKDFQYLIGNGDSIDTGGTSLKPVLVSDNIAQISVSGFEMSLTYVILKKLSFNMSYSYNYSIVTDFDLSEINSNIDLTENFVAEVSPHLFYAGITWKNKYFTFNLNCNYIDEQWFDAENSLVVEDYFIANIKISKTFRKHFNIYVDIQNILDNEFVDRKGQLSPGRFLIGGLKFIF